MQSLLASQYGNSASKQKDSYQAKEVKNTIAKKATFFQKCYKNYLLKKPKTTAGQLVVDWQIDAEGRVKQPGLIYNPFNQKFGDCILTVLEKTLFPPPPFQLPKYIEHSLRFMDEAALKADQKKR